MFFLVKDYFSVMWVNHSSYFNKNVNQMILASHPGKQYNGQAFWTLILIFQWDWQAYKKKGKRRQIPQWHQRMNHLFFYTQYSKRPSLVLLIGVWIRYLVSPLTGCLQLGANFFCLNLILGFKCITQWFNSYHIIKSSPTLVWLLSVNIGRWLWPFLHIDFCHVHV